MMKSKPSTPKAATPLAKKMKMSKSPKATPAKPTPAKATPTKAVITLKPGGDSMDKKQVSSAVSQLLKHLEASKSSSELFDSDNGKIHLQIAGIKLPRDERRQLLKLKLPNVPLPSPFDVCLIVKDLEKGIRPDHEPTKEHFNALLAEKGAKVDCVLPLRELKVEYKPYEAKTQLCHKYDKFLVDERIARLVPKFLGKPFYKRKRFPVPVDLTASDLSSELNKAVRTSVLPLNNHGNCAMVHVANAEMPAADIEENILAAGAMLAARYPGGWKNIRSVHVKAENSLSVPLHVSTTSPNDVGYVDSTAPKKEKAGAAKGELSTQPGMEVTVLSSGKVKINRTQDPEWDDEKDQPFVEGSESEEESDEEEEVKKKEKASKKKKSKKDESEDEDAEMEDAELKYMQKVADEEEEMEAKAGKEGKKEEEVQEEASEEEEGDEEEGSDEDEGDEEEGSDEEESDLDEDDVVVDEDDDDEGSDNDDSDADLMVNTNGEQVSDDDDE